MRAVNKLREPPVLDAEPEPHERDPEVCRPIKLKCSVCGRKVALLCHGASILKWSETTVTCDGGHSRRLEASWLQEKVAHCFEREETVIKL